METNDWYNFKQHVLILRNVKPILWNLKDSRDSRERKDQLIINKMELKDSSKGHTNLRMA